MLRTMARRRVRPQPDELADSVVVDTNVGIVANLTTDVSPECALACVRALREITEGGHLTLDANGIICAEYRRYLSMAGQPGTGDAFVRWVHDNQYNADLCTLIPLTPIEDEASLSSPRPKALVNFDRADRKFVPCRLRIQITRRSRLRSIAVGSNTLRPWLPSALLWISCALLTLPTGHRRTRRSAPGEAAAAHSQV